MNNFSGARFLSAVFRYTLCAVCCLWCAACSFDYGNQDEAGNDQPDIVMENVEYVRMRSGNPVARFQAEKAERFEERQRMALRNFTFEQFEKQTGDVNAYGMAGSAEVQIDTGDIHMEDGVIIEVDSEDITIETSELEWKDKERTLRAGAEEPVNILRSNGTSFSGVGFSADARRRTWEFTSGVGGSYIHDDEEDEEESEDEAAETSENDETATPDANTGADE